MHQLISPGTGSSLGTGWPRLLEVPLSLSASGPLPRTRKTKDSWGPARTPGRQPPHLLSLREAQQRARCPRDRLLTLSALWDKACQPLGLDTGPCHCLQLIRVPCTGCSGAWFLVCKMGQPWLRRGTTIWVAGTMSPNCRAERKKRGCWRQRVLGLNAELWEIRRLNQPL